MDPWDDRRPIAELSNTEFVELKKRINAEYAKQKKIGWPTSSKNFYPLYLATKAWQDKRLEALDRAQYRCQLCGERQSILHVHHNSYENIGNEKEEDLIVLCDKCHERFHDIAEKVAG